MFDVGDTVGPYRIVSRLSEGGMASLLVGRREDAPDSELVAIKVIHEHLSQDWQFVRMFVDEALISVRLRHPNVVRVDELGEEEQLYYLVMEYVRGCSLADLLRTMGREGRRMRPELAVWIAREVAAGLHAAHEMVGQDGALLGVVHRDVSPQNILLSVDGRVKLLDFGIAKARDRADRTEAGVIKGKVRYMAPEQAAGQPIDRRVDVYALGVVLWEMLTMRRYIEGKSEVELIRKVRAPEPVAPSVHAAGIDPRIDRAVLNALDPIPDRRPATADVLRERFDAALPVPIGPPHIAELLRVFMGPIPALPVPRSSEPPAPWSAVPDSEPPPSAAPSVPAPSAPASNARSGLASNALASAARSGLASNALASAAPSAHASNGLASAASSGFASNAPSVPPSSDFASSAPSDFASSAPSGFASNAPSELTSNALASRVAALSALTSNARSVPAPSAPAPSAPAPSAQPPFLQAPTTRSAPKLARWRPPPREPTVFGWAWRIALIVVAAFVVGAGLAFAWVQLGG